MDQSDFIAEQENEIEVLKSIFDKEFKTLCEREEGYPKYSVIIKSEVVKGDTNVKMTVEYPPTYPKVVPFIEIESEELDKEHIEGILKQIKNKSKELVKHQQVFIYDLVSEIQNYISELLSDENQTSLHEKMIARQNAIKLLEEKEKKKKTHELEETLNKKIDEEFSRKEQHLIREYNAKDMSIGHFSKRIESKELHFSSITFGWKKGSVIGRSKYSVSFQALNLQTNNEIAIKELVLPISTYARNILAQREVRVNLKIDTLKETYKSYTYIQHDYLAKYFGVELNQTNAEREEYTLRIFREYLPSSIFTRIKSFGPIKESAILAKYISQIVLAVSYLHNRGLYHGNICTQNILIDNSGDGRIKLADFGFKSIMEITHTLKKQRSTQQLICDDIWNIGASVIDMASGGKTLLYGLYDSMNQKIQIPNYLSQDIQEFLCKCMKESTTTAQLLNHKFNSYSFVDYSINFDLEKNLRNSLQLESSINVFSKQLSKVYNSRYKSDYEEMEFLGKGGFGEVVKVRNNLDGRFYAIKKIRLSESEKESKKILREVTTFASLHHVNLVRYFHSWIEEEVDKASLPGSKHNTDSDEEDSESDDDGKSNDFDDDVEWGTIVESSTIGNNAFSDSEEDEEYLPYNPDEDDDEDVTNELGNLSDEIDDLKVKKNKNDDLAKSRSLSRSSSIKNFHKRRILYIQMEYCMKTTLRTYIDSKNLDEDTAWKLFCQILDGLNYIHQQGTVHRDLKPANIFLDSNYNVKIGDFGLAAQSESKIDLNASMTQIPPITDLDSSGLSCGVGTTLYCAPEQMVDTHYDQKVDMFSLGILFFEMLYPFSTLMERAAVLTSLRNLEFPSSFSEQFPTQLEIISKLLQPNPKDRPSASDLLKSDLLPQRLEENILMESMRIITVPNTTLFSNLMKKLFSHTPDDHLKYTYNSHTTIKLDSALEASVREEIENSLTQIFKRHCAHLLQTPLLTPKISDYLNGSYFLDDMGTVVMLPYDLTLPFASLIAGNLRNIKRYSFDTVYRKNLAGGQPRHFRECDFDIVGPSANQLIIEAEVLKVLDEVLTYLAKETSSSTDDHAIYVNHTKIISSIFDICEIEEEKRQQVCEILDHSWKLSWSRVSKYLLEEAELPIKSVDQLKPYLEIISELNDLNHTLPTTIRNIPAISDVIKEFSAIHSILKNFGINCIIRYNSNIYRNCNYNDGIIFKGFSKSSSKQEVVAVGGSYGALFSKFQLPNSVKSQSKVAVGVSFELDKFVNTIATNRSMFMYNNMYSPTADVYICCGELEIRMRIASQLWAENIKAEFLPDNIQFKQEHFTYCQKEGIPWLVMLNDKPTSDLVKVFNLRTNKENVVPLLMLPNVIRGGDIPTGETASPSKHQRNVHSHVVQPVIPPQPPQPSNENTHNNKDHNNNKDSETEYHRDRKSKRKRNSKYNKDKY